MRPLNWLFLPTTFLDELGAQPLTESPAPISAAEEEITARARLKST